MERIKIDSDAHHSESGFHADPIIYQCMLSLKNVVLISNRNFSSVPKEATYMRRTPYQRKLILEVSSIRNWVALSALRRVVSCSAGSRGFRNKISGPKIKSHSFVNEKLSNSIISPLVAGNLLGIVYKSTRIFQ